MRSGSGQTRPAGETDSVAGRTSCGELLQLQFQLHPPTSDYLPDAARFDVPQGFVRVRASRANLANVRQPGDDGYGSPEAVEQVHLLIWPANHSAPAVIKRWGTGD